MTELAMALTEAQFRTLLDAVFASLGSSGGGSSTSVVAPKARHGKLYELWVAVEVMHRLDVQEGYTPSLRRGGALTLRSKGGPIDPSYPSFTLSHPRQPDLELWTDIEFIGMSHRRAGRSKPATGAFYHELDLVVVEAGLTGRPCHDEIVIGVECKNTAKFEKRMVREAFGVRRELSLLATGRTRFKNWPFTDVPADPSSSVLVYASDGRVRRYTEPGKVYGIRFEHLPAP